MMYHIPNEKCMKRAGADMWTFSRSKKMEGISIPARVRRWTYYVLRRIVNIFRQFEYE
jgi:hypothetical protein